MVSIRTFSFTEIQIYKEYQITNIGSASVGQLLAFQIEQPTGNVETQQVVILEARGDSVVFKFGGSSVTADKGVTNNALVDGNFSVAQGAIFGVTINGKSQNYVSCITENSGGTGIIRLGTMRL